MKKAMFNGKMKAITFSYDDGVQQDKRLVNVLNTYGLKCTFNLNSAIQTEQTMFEWRGHKIRRLNKETTFHLYDAHEIAVHTLTHPDLVQLTDEEVRKELADDKWNHERTYGVDVCGMAYPFGTYNEKVKKVAKEVGLLYGRTVQDTHGFQLPKEMLEWHPTCHHNAPNLMELAREFIETDFKEPSIFYIWGHSYEFDVEQNWDEFEAFCKYISNREDIYYGTNGEIAKAINNIEPI